VIGGTPVPVLVFRQFGPTFSRQVVIAKLAGREYFDTGLENSALPPQSRWWREVSMSRGELSVPDWLG
jgi:hypothetical protein